MPLDAVTYDTVYQGRVHLVQPKHGFRTGTDSLLLAAAITLPQGGRALEIGCGVGGALLTAAFTRPNARFIGLDVDPVVADFARQGVDKNGFGERVTIEIGDAKVWVREWENAFDLVYSNPPFFTEGTISPPGAGKATAYLETLPLEAWLKAMVFAAKPRAPIVLLHRAAELARILAALDRWTGEITVLPVHPYPGGEANRVLIRARKGLRRGRVCLLAGLDVRNGPGEGLTPRMAAVKAGEALAWA